MLHYQVHCTPYNVVRISLSHVVLWPNIELVSASSMKTQRGHWALGVLYVDGRRVRKYRKNGLMWRTHTRYTNNVRKFKYHFRICIFINNAHYISGHICTTDYHVYVPGNQTTRYSSSNLQQSSMKTIKDTVFTLRAAYKLLFMCWRASSRFWWCGSYMTSGGQISNSTCHQTSASKAQRALPPAMPCGGGAMYY